MSPLSNANERDYETMYIENEDVKHNNKFEELKRMKYLSEQFC